MQSRQNFHNIIFEHYSAATKKKVADALLHQLADAVSSYHYEQYLQFRKQYPKSIKRYSTFQLKDLDHPQTFDVVINLLKNKFGPDYKEYACLILNMTESELIAFEKNRENFYNMF
jgi:hypothetical protein